MLENTPVNACFHTHLLPYKRGLIHMRISTHKNTHKRKKFAGVRGNETHI